MFTGIITNLGQLKKRDASEFTFVTDSSFIKKLDRGTSVSINGACMTVTNLIDSVAFTVEVMPESEKRTMFRDLTAKDFVNLELPATPTTFLSGHLVQGHVDGVGTLKEIKHEGISKLLTFLVPTELLTYIVEKGSVAINGISLTVIDVNTQSFTVGIIPHTWDNTMLREINIGDTVNIETDVLAKYAEKLLRKEGK